MRIDSASEILHTTINELNSQSVDPKACSLLVDTTSEALRVLNISSLDIVDDIFEPAFGELAFNVLGDIANDERVKRKTELYDDVEQLFFAVRNGTANLEDFFNKVLGRTL